MLNSITILLTQALGQKGTLGNPIATIEYYFMQAPRVKAI